MLSSLEEALREVRSGAAPTGDRARVRQAEDVAEEIRRFEHTYGPLLKEAVAVQRQLRQHPDLRDLEPLRVGPDGRIGPEALERVERLTQMPAVAALGASAARQGCKGMGLVTASAEAAVVIGGQAGAELVWLWPYKVGTFRTPNRVVGRAWYAETIGVDIGYSATLAPVPLDLSFWFLPPESTSHLVGAYLGYEGPPLGPLLIPLIFGGVRVELFGWVPDVPPTGAEPPPEPSSIISDAFKYIAGFRIVAEVGLHLAIGVIRKGHQITTAGGFDLATYYISPTNLQTGVQYDGSDAGHPLVSGGITCPQRDDVPSNQPTTADPTFEYQWGPAPPTRAGSRTSPSTSRPAPATPRRSRRQRGRKGRTSGRNAVGESSRPPGRGGAGGESLGRSRGGLTSKLHLGADGRCRPLSLVVTGGHRADRTQLQAVLEKIRVSRAGPGRPRTKPDSLAADKAFSNGPCRQYPQRRGIRTPSPRRPIARPPACAKCWNGLCRDSGDDWDPRTMAQLNEQRLKPAERQEPTCALRTYRRGQWAREVLADPDTVIVDTETRRSASTSGTDPPHCRHRHRLRNKSPAWASKYPRRACICPRARPTG